MDDQAMHKRLRIAYLNTQYPSLSHTFIEREVRMLRELGVDVDTFSIRRPDNNGVLGDEHAKAAGETYYLLDGCSSLTRSLFKAVVCRPLSTLRGFIASQRLSPPGVKTHVLHGAYFVEALRLAHEMHRRGLKHVHVHMANNGASVAYIAAKINPSIKYSMTIHGSAEFFDVHNVRLREKAENAAFVRCISHFCQGQVMTWTKPESWRRFHIVHCGIDPGAFAARIRDEDKAFRILTVGRMVAIKGYPLVLEACRTLVNRGVDCYIDMVGDGPLRSELEHLANELGITDRVTFSGPVGQDRIQAHFDRADVMVVSSFMEGVPVVLMEAMAKRLAVVATWVGGIPELIEHGRTGLLVEPNSVDSLVDALEQLALNRSFGNQLGEAAREFVEQEFSIQNSAVQISRLFEHYVKKAA